MPVFPLFPILFLIFLTLKLCNVIAWSWLWVTAPLWGGFLLGVLILAAAIALREYAFRQVVARRSW
jgi:hypothetical protein